MTNRMFIQYPEGEDHEGVSFYVRSNGIEVTSWDGFSENEFTIPVDLDTLIVLLQEWQTELNEGTEDND